jgi:hypothetical protein
LHLRELPLLQQLLLLPLLYRIPPEPLSRLQLWLSCCFQWESCYEKGFTSHQIS